MQSHLNLRRPKLTTCHEIACLKAQEHGWPISELQIACQRFIATIPPAVVQKLRFSDEASRQQCPAVH